MSASGSTARGNPPLDPRGARFGVVLFAPRLGPSARRILVSAAFGVRVVREIHPLTVRSKNHNPQGATV
jgi:hypothetical protein